MSKTILKLQWIMLAAVLWTGVVSAAPFDKQIQYKQPDGTVIQLRGWGDEFYATFETLSGYTVVFDQSQQAYCFAKQNAAGELASLGVQAHLADPGSLNVTPHQRASAAVRKSQMIARWQKWESQMQVQAKWQQRKAALNQVTYGSKGQITYAPPSFTTTGNKLGLTLLVDFSDDVGTIPQAEVINYCNGDNYTGFGNNGSVKQFYYNNSGGLLTYSNVVTVYIRVPQPKTFYNDVTKDAGDQGNLLIKDALDALKALPNYNSVILPTLANLTVDGANQVVACNVFFAGENSGVWPMGLWPHSWGLYNVGAQPLGNGKSVFRYQITDISTSLTLATFCHENGHMLCDYPDVYDYDYDSVGGAGNFCLMAYSGSNPRNPSQICAYLKRASGWGTTVELDSTSALLATAGAAATTGTNLNQFYRYQKPGVPTEYFIIENRQRLGHDANLPGAGLAIWHIDELGDHSNQNTNYNSTHANFEISLVQADNRFDFERNANYGDVNDLYYSSNSAVAYTNAFNDFTGPRAWWWNGSYSGLKISAISGLSTNMTFIVGDFVSSNLVITAPLPPWGTNLANLNGGNPNGDWYLFVQDDKPIDIGAINGGWSVSLISAEPVGYAADNQIYCTPTLANVSLGGNWVVTLAVTNYGPSASSNVVVTSALPLGPGISYVSSTTANGSFNLAGSVHTWTVGNLPVGAGATLTLTLQGNVIGTYTNSITVSAATPDPNPDNDTVNAVANVAVLTPPAFASITFSGGVPTFTVTNASGPVSFIIQAATNLVPPINWVSIATNVTPFTDSNATNFPVRFYRALLGP